MGVAPLVADASQYNHIKWASTHPVKSPKHLKKNCNLKIHQDLERCKSVHHSLIYD